MRGVTDQGCVGSASGRSGPAGFPSPQPVADRVVGDAGGLAGVDRAEGLVDGVGGRCALGARGFARRRGGCPPRAGGGRRARR